MNINCVEIVRMESLWAVYVNGQAQGWFSSLREASRFVNEYLLVS